MKEITLPKREAVTDWVELNKKQKIEVDYPSRAQQQKLQNILLDDRNSGTARSCEFCQFLIKYTIKNWEGFPEKLKLINNEIEDEQWWSLVSDMAVALELGALIAERIGFSTTDKKKLKS